jgi:hypothetical protein
VVRPEAVEEPLTQTDEEREERGVHEGRHRIRARRWAQTRWVALIGALALSGGAACKSDEGGPVYARAQARAEELLAVGTPPSDPRYDDVLKDLATVAPESRFYKKAQSLRERLLKARALAPRPLAQTPDADDPALARKQAECVALAMALGRADAGEREGVGKRLRECQDAVDRYREQKHESQTP